MQAHDVNVYAPTHTRDRHILHREVCDALVAEETPSEARGSLMIGRNRYSTDSTPRAGTDAQYHRYHSRVISDPVHSSLCKGVMARTTPTDPEPNAVTLPSRRR